MEKSRLKSEQIESMSFMELSKISTTHQMDILHLLESSFNLRYANNQNGEEKNTSIEQYFDQVFETIIATFTSFQLYKRSEVESKLIRSPYIRSILLIVTAITFGYLIQYPETLNPIYFLLGIFSVVIVDQTFSKDGIVRKILNSYSDSNLRVSTIEDDKNTLYNMRVKDLVEVIDLFSKVDLLINRYRETQQFSTLDQLDLEIEEDTLYNMIDIYLKDKKVSLFIFSSIFDQLSKTKDNESEQGIYIKYGFQFFIIMGVAIISINSGNSLF